MPFNIVQINKTRHLTRPDRRSKDNSIAELPATLERHGRSFRHISPLLTVEEFTHERVRLFIRRETKDGM